MSDIEEKSAAPSGDAFNTAPSTIEIKPVEPAGDAPKTEIAAAPLEPLKAELPAVEAPKLAAETPKLAEVKAVTEDAAPTPPPPHVAAAAAAAAAPSPRANRFGLLAASVAIAATVGVVAGALGASGLMRPAEVAAAPGSVSEDAHALQGSLVQLRADLAALKTSIDSGAKNANGQFAKIAERFDRVERAQAEPATKITKAAEALERLEKRVDAVTPRETTGTVSALQPVAAPAQPAQPAIVDGWVVRDVFRGAAIIQGRRYGMIEVEAGDTIPGVGRVEAIRRQEGRWVVVTSKGLITSPR